MPIGKYKAAFTYEWMKLAAKVVASRKRSSKYLDDKLLSQFHSLLNQPELGVYSYEFGNEEEFEEFSRKIAISLNNSYRRGLIEKPKDNEYEYEGEPR